MHRSVLASSVHVLYLAVLRQALIDLQAWSPTVRRDAWEWLMTDRRAALPFDQVCAALNIDAADLRVRLLDARGRLLAAPVANERVRGKTRLIAFLRDVSGTERPQA